MRNWRAIWQPELYHGWGKRPPFFEGWYFKLVDAGESHRYAVIPGVFLGAEPGSSHCFVQTLDGATGHTTYHRYPYEAFRAAPDEFNIWVGPNNFRVDGLLLDINAPDRRMRGALRFEGRTPWPVTLASPGTMGWYAYAPFMECYHGVVSLDHAIDGFLEVDGRLLDFRNGRGYIEKDWGQAFPQAWVWMQTNHFAMPGTSLTASIAIIPWLGNQFDGYIAGLWHEGQLYRFATYTGAQLQRFEVDDDRVVLHLADRPDRPGGYRLEITAQRSHAGLLHSPERTAMLQRVLESLTATVHVRLVAQGAPERVIFEGTGRHAGLEVVGPVDEMRITSKE